MKITEAYTAKTLQPEKLQHAYRKKEKNMGDCSAKFHKKTLSKHYERGDRV